MEQHILYIPEVQSSNTILKDFVRTANAKQPFALYTDFQTSGRGQHGNVWESNKGENLLVSFLVTDIKQSAMLPVFNMASALAIVHCLKRWGISYAKVKWPNDIYVGDMKIAGILLENIFEGSRLKACIIGVGLNVNQEAFGAYNACSMKSLSAKNYAIKPLLADLYDELYRCISLEPEAILTEVNTLLYKKNKVVTFQHAEEYKKYNICSIAMNGNLVVNHLGNELEIEHHNYKWIA